MEIKITTKQILQILHALSWIIFLGLCFEAGSFFCNAFLTLGLKLNGANYFGLGALYAYDQTQFLVELMLMGIAATLKAILFYLIIKILYDKKLDMIKPFSSEIGRFMINIAYLALGIGLFSLWGAKNTESLVSQGVAMPDTEHLRIGGADVWFFMSVILFVIAQIFKRGIEIQSENELTI